MRRSTGGRAGVLFGAAMLVAGTAATWATWRYFVTDRTGQLLDGTALRGSEIGRGTLWQVAEPVVDVVSVSLVVAVLGAAALATLLHRRWLLAVQVTLLVGGANITTQVLKRAVLDRPSLATELDVTPNSLPSGHTTVAASIAAALILMAPARLRPLMALAGAGYAAATGLSTMIGGWHRPSDVAAAITVVTAWAGMTTMVTALAGGNPEPSRNTRHALPFIILLLAGGAVAAGLALSALARTKQALATGPVLDDRADLATAYLGGALGVVAVTSVAFAAILLGHYLARRPARSTVRS